MKDYRKLLEEVARRTSYTSEVFHDFVTMGACCLAAGTREKDYLEVAGRYSKDDLNIFAEALASLICEMEDKPFEGLSLTLGGGDGADNVTDPDLIIPLTGADICMWFPDNDTACAGVCFDSCFVYFSFPWEAIDNQADRDTLMARVLNYLRNFGGITDIAKPESPLILSAVPNPFNASTELGFELSSPGDVSLDIFDISGRKVANLANGTFEDGVHELAWDGRDNTNRELPSGIYMARLVAGEKIVTKKLLLAK